MQPCWAWETIYIDSVVENEAKSYPIPRCTNPLYLQIETNKFMQCWVQFVLRWSDLDLTGDGRCMTGSTADSADLGHIRDVY